MASLALVVVRYHGSYSGLSVRCSGSHCQRRSILSFPIRSGDLADCPERDASEYYALA